MLWNKEYQKKTVPGALTRTARILCIYYEKVERGPICPSTASIL
jgi:hypothetical protein